MIRFNPSKGAAVASTLFAFSASATEPPSLESLARGVCERSLSSESLVTRALERGRGATSLNAFVTLDEPGAMAAARAVDAAGDDSRCLALAGIPVVVKDNIHVAGLPSTAGTPALAGFVPAEDAPIVARLRAAGAVILGKTQMHELAFGISGYNPAFTKEPVIGVRNAWDPGRSAGGSSSGSGAAVGARIVSAALGTDTGGSVRIPCAFNGCASLRPTMGRYPAAGIAPISHTRDTPGPMAASVRDVELLDRVVTDADAQAPVDLNDVRLGLMAQSLANMDTDTGTVFRQTMERLRAAGVTIVEIDAPDLPALNGAVSFPIALAEARTDMLDYLGRHDTGVTLETLAARIASPDVKATYEGLVLPGKLPGPDDTLVDAGPVYERAIAEGRPRLIAYYDGLFTANRVDALVFPTVPIVAMPADPESSGLATFGLVIQNTDPGSNAGLPGLQLPAGVGPQTGLPVGLELDGPAGSDRRLIGIGLAIEALLGRLPPPTR